MIPRELKLPTVDNVLLFGPRGVGKTTYLKALPGFAQSIYINLLLAEHENRFVRRPDELIGIVKAAAKQHQVVIIDEVQKIPKLLDVVHEIVEQASLQVQFILTGSSARKLKHGGANLLAGRAFVYHLSPFVFTELDEQFSLEHALRWGMLPKLLTYDSDEQKYKYLESYVNTYLKEEVWAEQFIRQLDPFRYFLEVSAQSNGKIINFSNIARDVGVTHATVVKYYSILEDTLLGFFLQPFQHSFRKRLNKAPKFYYFDPGVVRALSRRLSIPLQAGTSGYGDSFEHFVILQCLYLAKYHHPEYRFSYLKTKDDAEIDLVVERPGLPTLFIEIKSAEQVETSHLNTLKRLAQDFGECEAVCFSRELYPREVNNITVLPWQTGLRQYFG